MLLLCIYLLESKKVSRPFTLLKLLFVFSGNQHCSSIINNFMPKTDIEYYSIPHGTESSPKIPPKCVSPLYKLVMQVMPNPPFYFSSINLLNHIFKTNNFYYYSNNFILYKFLYQLTFFFSSFFLVIRLYSQSFLDWNLNISGNKILIFVELRYHSSIYYTL